MRAKVTTAFHGVEPDPELTAVPAFFHKGDEITHQTAHNAVEAGFAEWVEPPSDEERSAVWPFPVILTPAFEI
jgi:hypothetical protein